MSRAPCVLCGVQLDAPSGAAAPTVVACARCGLLHTHPRPTRDVTSAEIFDTTYAGARLAHRAQWQSEARTRIGWLTSIVPAPSRLLEVGCATGEFVCEAAERGFVAVGHDSSTWAVQRARELCEADFFDGDLPTVDGGFDVIAMFHVIEHLHEPGEVMTQLRDRLRPGGYVVAELPNAAARHAVEDIATWPNFEPDEHVAHYDRRTLTALLEQAGLQAVAIRTASLTLYDPSPRRLRRWARWLQRGWVTGSQDLLRVVARRP